MKKFRFLPQTYFPNHTENRMKNEGDVKAARQHFYSKKPNNLTFLLRERYGWMNDFILESDTRIFELGAGPGFSKSFITNSHLSITDILENDWIDLRVDALSLPFKDGEVDVLICSHMIHHLAHPKIFFEKVAQVLRPGGVVLVSEIDTTGFLMRFLLRLMRHEGWSYEVDVFSDTEVANDPIDPWSANCAIPEMLFRDEKKFHETVPQLKIEKNELTECLIFPISGGVIAKTPTVNLPNGILSLLRSLDGILIKYFPAFFAMGRRVVLRKILS